MADENRLDHPKRARIYAVVQEDPGIHPRKIARRLHLHPSTVTYHVNALEAVDVVESMRRGRYRHLFTANDLTRVEKAVAAAMHRPAKRAVIRILDDPVGQSQAAIADRLDIDRSTVKHHVDDLHDDGVLIVDPDGVSTRVRLSPDARRLVEQRR